MSGEPWSEFSFRLEGRIERVYSSEEAAQLIADGRLTANTSITVYGIAGPVRLVARDHAPIQPVLFPDGPALEADADRPVAPGLAEAEAELPAEAEAKAKAVDAERLNEVRHALAATIAARASTVDLAKPRTASIARPATAPPRHAKPATAAPGPGPAPFPEKYASIPLILLSLYRFAEFSGRSSRGEYWAFVLGFAICCAIAGILASAEHALAPYAALGLVVLLIPGLAVSVRWLNDFSVPGWLLVLVVAALLLLSPPLGSLAMIGLALLPGSDRPNASGQPPTV